MMQVQLLPVTDPLATASVLSLMEDREGNLWVGTEADGLHILRDQRFRTLGAREGLSSDATTAVVEDKAGTLWVGTNGSGLNAMRPESNPAMETHPSHNNNDVARVGHPAMHNATRTTGSESKTALVKTYTVRDGLLSDVILSLAAAPNGDALGRNTGWTEPDSRGPDRCIYLGGWAAGRLHPLSSRGRRWLAVDWHAARTDALDERSKRSEQFRLGNAHGDLYAAPTDWAATWWARWRATPKAICGWRPMQGCRGSTGARLPTTRLRTGSQAMW